MEDCSRRRWANSLCSRRLTAGFGEGRRKEVSKGKKGRNGEDRGREERKKGREMRRGRDRTEFGDKTTPVVRVANVATPKSSEK